ncbi:MAG: hypothetical protein ABSH26_12945 [Opitutaceae bacterium]|jgi:hypothetical protein
MTSLLYLFQAAVVFLCPAFFGWVVLRRVVREHDWLVLLPGSVVVGCVALMAAMNELRYWLEMPIGAWFAYKFLLAAAFALIIFTRRPRFGLQLAGGARRKLWMGLALAGTAMTALYFGVPAARGLLNDSWWFHYPAATLVEDLKYFPLPSVFAPDDPLYYHFGPDILAGTWAFLLDCPVQTGFAAVVCIFAPCAFLLGYALVLRGSRSHLGALAGAAFLVVGGNLLFVRLATAGSFSGLHVLERLNSGSVDGLLKLMFTPSHACGIPAVLVGIVIFWRFCVRPSWPLAALLGLWTGALTLIAEWYFFPFLGAVGLILVAKALVEIRRGHLTARSTPLIWLRVAPLAIAVGWGFFNNTYVSGVFGHFWMHGQQQSSVIGARMEQSRFDQESRDAQTRHIYYGLTHKFPLHKELPPGAPPGDSLLIEFPWTPPGLVPLKLNLRHFGLIPSWEGAGSSGGTFVPMLGFRFIAECTPVILLGLPFGLWLALRRKQPILRLLALLALLSVLPPIFLDWGFRSTDFLRFFTGAFSFSALLLGWLVGHLWGRGPRLVRAAALLICGCVLVNPFIIGLIGLNGSTFAAVRDVNQSAGSLKKASQEEKAAPAATGTASGAEAAAPAASGTRAAAPPAANVPAQLSPAQRRAAALTKLAELARRYLYPQTLGRERAIVIVPTDAIPPTEVFPEWLRLATLAHVQLPVGWYWSDSYYAAYYREAVTSLSPESVTALDARWIIVSNLFGPAPPKAVNLALSDTRRFIFARQYISGPYYLNIYRALPFSASPPGADEE